jgi:hypothetical protein
MTISKLELLKTRVKSIKATLERASEKQKSGPAGMAIADNFNTLLDEIEAACPDLKGSLPSRITPSRHFAHLGVSNISYLDLEVFADQALSLLELIPEKP